VDVTLLKRTAGACWQALARPAKRLKAGDRIDFGNGGLTAEVVARGEAGEVVLAFDRSDAVLDAALARFGSMPLPPYIALKRDVTAADAARYQTVFAANDGAVAAPTAGLHFTTRLLDALTARGVALHRVTLHVGAGTFLAVKTETIGEHRMHSEWCAVSGKTADALNETRARGGRIVAVGTTALRTLESAADDAGLIQPFSAETALFITPGYRFRAVDVLMTNFHLPRSTLFMLVAAFSGLTTMREAYAHAIRAEYRFYSYGDACLLLPGG
jgi:S-adenosylmethionine:tRNA ribosyltransferase-isomerase